MANYKKHRLTEAEKDLIKQMFFGPYLECWKNDKGVVDNRDATIAKRLKRSKIAVHHYIKDLCEEHFNNLSNKTEDDKNEI